MVRKLVADPIAAVAVPLPMPLEAPVTIATLSDSLLIFTILGRCRAASYNEWRPVEILRGNLPWLRARSW